MSVVLVVDDDLDVRQYIGDVLEMAGHTVRFAEDGNQALREIEQDRPDCVVLDVMMPGLSGHQVLAQVRQSDGGPNLPVVMLTAAADENQAWRAWTGGVDFFLAKPFDSDQLLRCLDHLSGREGDDGNG